MRKELVSLANILDLRGLIKEADFVDYLLRRADELEMALDRKDGADIENQVKEVEDAFKMWVDGVRENLNQYLESGIRPKNLSLDSYDKLVKPAVAKLKLALQPPDPVRASQSYTGLVVKKPFAVGSKSERLAVMLETENGDYVLGLRGVNSLQNPRLNSLVGENVLASGELHGYTLILDDIRPAETTI